MKRLTLLIAFLGWLLPASAEAFCGFYVSGAKSSLYNDATMVSLLRDGERTVMAMRNQYQGPPEDFAMVVPVPEVLDKQQVDTLKDGVFQRLDKLTAPRLVKYWERDPCWEPPRSKGRYYDFDDTLLDGQMKTPDIMRLAQGVTVEAQFKKGEYDIVILSAKESNGLESWLKQNNYNIPKGAAKYFRPYVQQGQYFFVAKVDVDRVNFEKGPKGTKRAVLSPLRFFYDSKEFKLPIRLGLINSKGKQDLVGVILSREGRYEVANRPNVAIPTNLRVDASVEQQFEAFYDRLFTRTLQAAAAQEENETTKPPPVVTEYAWSAGKCDPCPRKPMSRSDLGSLGGDVIERVTDEDIDRSAWEDVSEFVRDADELRPREWTLTRLHTRYGTKNGSSDLVFRQAKGIRGGVGTPRGQAGVLQGKKPRETNAASRFQGRYVILKPWAGKVTCDNPRRGRWKSRPPSGMKEKGDSGSGGGEEPLPLEEVVADGDWPFEKEGEE